MTATQEALLLYSRVQVAVIDLILQMPTGLGPAS